MTVCSLPASPSTRLFSQPLPCTFLVRVDNDMSWTLSYHGIRLEAEQCQASAAIPRRITSVSDVTSLLSIVNASRICCGNPVEDFKELVDVHRGEFRDATGVSSMYMCTVECLCIHLCIYCREQNCSIHIDIDSQSATIWLASCELLLPGDTKSIQCKQCLSFQAIAFE